MKNMLINLQNWVDAHSRPLNALCIATFASALILFAAAFALPQVRTGVPKDQTLFASQQEAAEAIVSAAEKSDEAALKEILGSNSYDLIHTGEPAADKDLLQQFATMAREKMSFSADPKNRSKSILLLGNDNWPFAIPLQKAGTKWYFDTNSGRQELLFRRIGRNELDAIQICRGYVEAQNDYSSTKHDNSMVNQYAQRIISTPGKHDGLAWQNDDGSWGGMVGDKAAKAIQDSYTGKVAPFHGYYFKVLKGQGPAAPKGAMDYMVNGAMIGGFALLAYPAVYQATGVKSFMVSNDGLVWEKDLGPDSLKAADSIELFNPDKTWKPVLVDQ